MKCAQEDCKQPTSGKSKYCATHKAEARKRWLEMIASRPRAAERKDDFNAILQEAHAAAVAAVAAVKPTPMVVVQRENPFDDKSPIVKQYEPVEGGVCGFAWINIRPATQAFARYLKERFDPHTGPNGKRKPVGVNAGDLDYYGHAGYYGGFELSVGYYGQSMERKLAHAQAFAEVLNKHGVKAYASSRMD